MSSAGTCCVAQEHHAQGRFRRLFLQADVCCLHMLQNVERMSQPMVDTLQHENSAPAKRG